MWGLNVDLKIWMKTIQALFAARNSKNMLHYENTPMQIYGKLHPQKLKIFR